MSIRTIFDNDPSILGVKLIKDRATQRMIGYGFLDMKSHNDAARLLRNYNGKLMGHSSKKTFKLNWASVEKKDALLYTSLYIEEVDPDVTESMIMNAFQPRYPSVRSVKLHKAFPDPKQQQQMILGSSSSYQKTYGFVRFLSEDEAKHALTHMQGVRIGKISFKLFLAPKLLPQQPQSSTGEYFSSRFLEQPQPRMFAPTDPFDPSNTTLYVAGFEDLVNERDLAQVYGQFGEVMYVKLLFGRRAAFIQMATRAQAEDAMAKTNGALLGQAKIRVTWGKSSQGTGNNNNSGMTRKFPSSILPVISSNPMGMGVGRPPTSMMHNMQQATASLQQINPMSISASSSIIKPLSSFSSSNALLLQQQQQQQHQALPMSSSLDANSSISQILGKQQQQVISSVISSTGGLISGLESPSSRLSTPQQSPPPSTAGITVSGTVNAQQQQSFSQKKPTVTTTMGGSGITQGEFNLERENAEFVNKMMNDIKGFPFDNLLPVSSYYATPH